MTLYNIFIRFGSKFFQIGMSILYALKIKKQYSEMTTTDSGVYTDISVLYKPNIFQSSYFLIKIYNILKNDIRRKWTVLALCKWNRVCYTMVSDSFFNYLCNHTKSSCISFRCKGKHFSYLGSRTISVFTHSLQRWSAKTQSEDNLPVHLVSTYHPLFSKMYFRFQIITQSSLYMLVFSLCTQM